MNTKSDLPISFLNQSHLSSSFLIHKRYPHQPSHRTRAICLFLHTFFSFLFLTTQIAQALTIEKKEKNEVVLNSINGKKIYRKLCANCHGLKGETPKNVAVLLNANMKDLNRLDFNEEIIKSQAIEKIKTGEQNMPSFKTRLSIEQIEAVINHINSLGISEFSTDLPTNK